MFKSAAQKFCKVFDFVVEDHLVVEIVDGLEIESRIGHKEDPFNFDHGQNFFDFEISAWKKDPLPK